MSRLDVRPAGSRARTRTAWLDSRHSFSFGRHYDPGNTHFGLLVVANEDRVAPAGGFETHPHRDMEIVTWVLAGGLRHEDSTGHGGTVGPGQVQRMSAGTGVLHSERNAAAAGEAVHLVQMWVVPGAPGGSPGYAQRDVAADLRGGGLVPVAGGPDGAVGLGQPAAVFSVGRLRAGERVALPDEAYVHVFVALGGATLESGEVLSLGDAARLTAAGGPALTAGRTGTEVLVWGMRAAVGA